MSYFLLSSNSFSDFSKQPKLNTCSFLSILIPTTPHHETTRCNGSSRLYFQFHLPQGNSHEVCNESGLSRCWPSGEAFFHLEEDPPPTPPQLQDPKFLLYRRRVRHSCPSGWQGFNSFIKNKTNKKSYLSVKIC